MFSQHISYKIYNWLRLKFASVKLKLKSREMRAEVKSPVLKLSKLDESYCFNSVIIEVRTCFG